jgi:hypothetical protein
VATQSLNRYVNSFDLIFFIYCSNYSTNIRKIIDIKKSRGNYFKEISTLFDRDCLLVV